ncbi:MAG: DUF6067 family protein [Gemmatimonadales bacterium]
MTRRLSPGARSASDVIWCLAALSILALSACSEAARNSPALYRAPAIPDTVDGVVWAPGDWTPDLPAGEKGVSRGNHRAVVEVPDSGLADADEAGAVSVRVPWRRHDEHPERKSILVVDAGSGQVVANAVAARIDDAAGEIVFAPNPGSSVYYVYYMPWRSTGGYYPTVTYPSDLAPAPDSAWLAGVSGVSDLPAARTTRIESVNDFHSFFPMEVIATPEETRAFMDGAPDGWRLVAEVRDRPVVMRRFIPHHWTLAESPGALSSRVLRDENFTFQAVVVAGDAALENLEVSFTGFPDGWTWTCFNCGGIDEHGEPFTKRVDVAPGEIQPLWLGVTVPADAPAGKVGGRVTVTAAGHGAQTIEVSLEVRDGTAVHHGADEPELMTRLAWLNSTLGEDPGYVVRPFTPVALDGRRLSILGRRVELGRNGLPTSIESSFTPDVTSADGEARPILARPLALDVTVGGERQAFEPGDHAVRQASPNRVEWTAHGASDDFELTTTGGLESDGMLELRMSLVARRDVEVDDIAFPVAYEPGAATYMLGLGREGGRRPDSLDWKWAVEKHQEGMWLGGVNRGLQYVLRDENYVRPLNTNFYQDQPLELPPSWYNGGRGGIALREADGAVVARNYSGPRQLVAGDTLHFNVRMLITPFKPIDTARHFRTRFVHQPVPVDSVVAWGGTVVNIHHANDINPYINYPFYALDAMKAYIDEAHQKGVKFKLYNTIRELSYRAYELFALRSLGHEIINGGEGGGHSWLQEHLGGDYHAGWHAYSVDDAAVLDKGTSRWTNYYVEGIAWLAENQEIDGLYLDDIAFSRETVKRLVAVLQQRRPEVVIDLHSANQFNPRDGFINSAMLYMEHFPYISRLWFGEYFDYGKDPDYWMTEVSGLPFGLMGEMLQDGGRPYRGMIYGMTARKYGETDPRPVWKMMTDFGIADSRMYGYWLPDPPVGTGREDVRATAYVRPDRVLIALASWSDTDQVVNLDLDRATLGLPDDEPLAAHTPAVEGLQEAADVELSAVRVPAGGGAWVIVE